MGVDQRLDFGLQIGVPGAALGDKSRALGIGPLSASATIAFASGQSASDIVCQ